MKAIVKYKKGDGFVELREVTRPTVDSESVIIKVKAAGICGTDIHILHDEFKYSVPVTMGHEFSGEIVEVGKKVKGWNVGITKGIQITLPFSSGYTSWEKALHLIASKKINVASLITQRFSLKNWPKAFGLVKKGQAVKVLLIPKVILL